MYINLFLGLVVFVALWLLLKKLFVRDDGLRERPAKLFEQELARRAERERDADSALERLREERVSRMRAVIVALADIANAMPEDRRHLLSWKDEGETVIVRMAGRHEEPVSPAHAPDIPATLPRGGLDETLTVTWRIPEIVMDAPDIGRGEYHLRWSGVGRDASVSELDACIREISSFIVDCIT